MKVEVFDSDDKSGEKIIHLSRTLNTFGSCIMLLVIIAFGVYLIKHKRFEGFEIKILVSIFLTYSLSPIIYNGATDEEHPSSIHAFQVALKLFYHWVYSS